MNGPPPSRLREALRPGSLSGDTARIWTLQGAGLLFALVASIIVAKTLGPAEKGVVDLYLLLAALIGDLGGLGFGSGLLYYLANQRRSLTEVHGTGLVFAAAAGGVTALIGWAGLSVWEMILPGLHPWALLLAFALGPVIYYALIASNLLTGIDRAVLVHALAAANGLINLTAVLVLYSLGILRSGTVILVTAGLSVLLATASFAVLRRRAGPSRPSRELFGVSLRYGLVLHVGIVANFLHFKVDQLMLNYWLGTAAVGIYAVGVRWAEMLFLLDAALGAAALYRITSSDARESFRLSWRLV
ncbi:MAG: oligosaccharide flippase family protein, partial [Acidobacteriota bacterium]